MTYRIVNTDNFGSDYPDEKFVGEEYATSEEAATVADSLNEQYGDDVRRGRHVVAVVQVSREAEEVMTVQRITIITDPHRSDLVSLETDLPPSTWPYNDPPDLSFRVAKGEGALYVAANFPGVPVVVIDTRLGQLS